MKRKSLVLSCLMVFCLVVGVFSANAQNGYNITLEATSDGSTVQTNFAAGAELYLNINLDAGSDGVAGCAFTLTYDDTKLTAPPTTADGLPQTAGDITSIFPFTTVVDGTTTKTHRVNASETGKIYFSGAEITAEGGSKTHPYNVTLFTVKFTVMDPVTSGDAVFTLNQTMLLNEAAGWGTGGQAEGVPIIVGAIPKTDPNFGGDLTDDFPVKLATFTTPPTLTVTIGEIGPYEEWKAANGYNNPDIGGPMDDYDNDGFTNDQERLNNSDPTDGVTGDISNVDVTNPATWPAVGTGYNALSDFRVANLDVDGNGTAELGTDGVLMIRYLFGYRGAELIDGAIGSGAKRDTAAKIEAYLAVVNEAVYDVDDSGKPTLGEDGVMLLRYLFGYRGAELIQDAVDTTYCNRCAAAEIEAYIQKLFPN